TSQTLGPGRASSCVMSRHRSRPALHSGRRLMPVIDLDVTRRTPYEEGRLFGGAAYERLDGLARFAVDPTGAGSAAITDLGLAPAGADGRVHFAAGFCVLRPAVPGAGARRLLFVVANRGRLPALPFSRHDRPLPLEITERIEPGDGFLLQRGWTVAWC